VDRVDRVNGGAEPFDWQGARDRFVAELGRMRGAVQTPQQAMAWRRRLCPELPPSITFREMTAQQYAALMRRLEEKAGWTSADAQPDPTEVLGYPATGTLLHIRPDLIDILDQVRSDAADADIEELAESICELGMITPVAVAWQPSTERWRLVAGERRLRAALSIPMATVPARVVDGGDHVAAIQVAENVARRDLNPVDEARGLRAMLQAPGATQASVGRAIGHSQAYVSNALRLLALPERALALIQSGALTASHGIALLEMGDFPDAVAAVAEAAEELGASVDMVRTGAWGVYNLARAKSPEAVVYVDAYDLRPTCLECPHGAYKSGWCVRPDHYAELVAALPKRSRAADGDCMQPEPTPEEKAAAREEREAERDRRAARKKAADAVCDCLRDDISDAPADSPVLRRMAALAVVAYIRRMWGDQLTAACQRVDCPDLRQLLSDRSVHSIEDRYNAEEAFAAMPIENILRLAAVVCVAGEMDYYRTSQVDNLEGFSETLRFLRVADAPAAGD
jgi:ParB/RepB/Spo0J family partition protein